ncbi:MAG: hypothetical protein LBP36_02295 [Oscillospiraceae bacterium]|jgi:hypothetical protein|nr:hypothetical protein [Oscillospiraceae bacterium]
MYSIISIFYSINVSKLNESYFDFINNKSNFWESHFLLILGLALIFISVSGLILTLWPPYRGNKSSRKKKKPKEFTDFFSN